MNLVFCERIDPFEAYETEGAFRQRFRLSKAMVEELSVGFGRSEWASKGKRNSGGLSHRERVSPNNIRKIKKKRIIEKK